MSKIRLIRDAIVEGLMETGAFAGVHKHLPENWGRGASEITSAAVELPAGKEKPQYDNFDDDDQTMLVDEQLTVTLMVRNGDPDVRDDTALDLLQYLKNVVNGRELAQLTVGGHTYVSGWTPLPEKVPERRYRCNVAIQYLAENWDRDTDTQ